MNQTTAGDGTATFCDALLPWVEAHDGYLEGFDKIPVDSGRFRAVHKGQQGQQCMHAWSDLRSKEVTDRSQLRRGQYR